MNEDIFFKEHSKDANLELFLGVVCSLSGIVALKAGPIGFSLIIFGIISLIKGSWSKENAIITLRNEQLEIKLSAFGRTEKILFDHIKKVEESVSDSTIILAVKQEDESIRDFPLPIASLTQEDQEKCLTELKRRIHPHPAVWQTIEKED